MTDLSLRETSNERAHVQNNLSDSIGKSIGKANIQNGDTVEPTDPLPEVSQMKTTTSIRVDMLIGAFVEPVKT